MSHEEKTTDDIEREAWKDLAGGAETLPAEIANDAIDAKPEEDGTATEKPRAKTVSEMEKAVKARITAVANEKGYSAKKGGASTAVEVAKTQKRQKNKLLLGIGGAAVVVALIGMVGFHLWETTRTPIPCRRPAVGESHADDWPGSDKKSHTPLYHYHQSARLTEPA